MKFNDLVNSKPKVKKRVGRGIASGQGKTAGRGTKGQKSRSGSSKKPGFDGGQNPLMQRLPKLRGFTSHRKTTDVIYTGQLDSLGVIIDNNSLAEANIVENAHTKVKLINNGAIAKKHTVKLQQASASAILAVEKAGGQFALTAQVARQAKTKKEK